MSAALKGGNRRWIYVGAGVAVAGALAVWLLGGGASEPPPAYRLAKVEQGPIVSAITATGTVVPTVNVVVGSQLSGQIVALMADFNTPVKAEQPLAKLDTEQLDARLLSAQADLLATQASVSSQRALIEKAAADVETAHATYANMLAMADRAASQLKDAETDFARKEPLSRTGAVSTADADRARNAADSARAFHASARAQIDAARAGVLAATAQRKVAEATLETIVANVAQRSAAVRQIEVDLKRSTIRSPIDGVVVQRNIDVGQTVAASLQAPTLFTIAQDLRRMQVETTVDEADIGRVREGLDVSFTVNAYPSQPFSGKVGQVRLAPTNIQNVITYTVVVLAENPERKLLPGMTATVTIVTDRRDSVLRAPNAALRWRPAGTAPPAGPTPSAATSGGGEPGVGGGATGGGQNAQAAQQRQDAIKKALVEQLKLDKGQIEQLDRIFAQSRSEIVAVVQSGVAEGERRAKIRQITEASADRIAGMLNDEQKAKYAQIRAERAAQQGQGQGRATFGQAWIVGPDGAPKSVRVRLGVTDGSSTEISAPELKAGVELIVGGGPKAAAAGPRFGF